MKKLLGIALAFGLLLPVVGCTTNTAKDKDAKDKKGGTNVEVKDKKADVKVEAKDKVDVKVEVKDEKK